MKFDKSLNEYSDDVPLKHWNQVQKNMWHDLCKECDIERNDLDSFRKFATFFDLYYGANKKFPSTKEAKQAILSESLFVRTAGHYHTVHDEKRNQYADKKLNKKNKKTAPKTQKADDTVHMRDYLKTLRSGGKKPYLTWVHNIKTKI